MVSLLGSVHIHVMDSYEGIKDDQIMKITIPCDITMGGLGAGVAASIRRMDRARASECSAAEAS